MPDPSSGNVTAVRSVEHAARASYGRLLALLVSRSRDVQAAEDALAGAFHAALVAWPAQGVPDQPDAWLLTAARRKLIDWARHAQVERDARPSIAMSLHPQSSEGQTAMRWMDEAIPDERLAMLFLCAHPAIDESVHTALMLQSVLGLDARVIASAFIVSPAALSQRLVRAKQTIRDARLSFELPEPEHLAPRLASVLSAIYAAYNAGWSLARPASNQAGADDDDLATDALWLGREVARLMPREPEALGLLALMLYCESRRAARRGQNDFFVPLSEQDTALWNSEHITEADALLTNASVMGRPGRFQLEAAIQATHCARAHTGSTDWPTVVSLYEMLLKVAPSIGATVAHAAAVAELRGPAEGWALLSGIEPGRVADHQPYWATRAYLLRKLGRLDEARSAYHRSIGLSDDPAVRAYLTAMANDCKGSQFPRVT